MASSWNELSADHKIVFLLESLANEKEQQAPIACRICYKIFFDNKSLLNHFQSHTHQDGASNERPLVRSSAPPGNSSNFVSRSASQSTLSLSVPVNVSNNVAHENIGPHGSGNVSPNMPNPSTLSQNSVQLRGSSLTNKSQPYFSPSTSHGTFTSQPNQSSNFSSRFASQPTGPLNFHSPRRLAGTAVLALEAPRQSNLRFRTDRGNSGRAPWTGRRPTRTARPNELEGPFSGYTKLYLEQLERPIHEMVLVHNADAVHRNNKPDEVDLTLKL